MWKAVEERRDLKKKLMEAKSERLQNKYKLQYREVDRAVKWMARRDKREYVNNLQTRQKLQLTKENKGRSPR